MSDAKFTEGPWRKSGDATVLGADGKDVAYLARNTRYRAETEANALLIAAAPELLECAELLESLCVWLLHACGPDAAEGQEATFRLAKARASIAKALGNA